MEQKRFNTLAAAGKTALYWLLSMALAAAAQPVIIIGSKYTGEDVSSFIFQAKCTRSIRFLQCSGCCPDSGMQRARRP